VKYLFAFFLAANGLIHGLFLVPRPPDSGASWPFDPSDSWLLARIGVEPDVARGLAMVVAAVAVAAFIATAITWIGVLPIDWLQPIATVATVAGLVLLGIFFQPWLTLGVAIDAVLLWGLVVSGWSPE